MVKLNEIELQSKTIDWLRFPLAVLVIFIHMPLVRDSQNVDYMNFNLYNWYDITVILTKKIIANIAVPCFFMFSGYLFFNSVEKWNRRVYFAKIKIRLRTLVIPFILFNLSVIILYALLKILKADGSIYPYLNELYGNWYRLLWNYSSWSPDYVNIFGQTLQPCYGPYLLQLWFLRDLIVMVFISPAVYYLIKYTKIWVLVILGLCFYSKMFIEITGYSGRLFITAFFFFSLGAFFSINRKNIVVSLRKYQTVWFAVSLTSMILWYFFVDGLYGFFAPVFVLSGVISAVNITSYFIEHGRFRVSETLSRASFFIYCTHCILITDWVYRAFNKIFDTDATLLVLFVRYFTAPFVCVGIIICIYLIMRRFIPKILNLFTGNR
ncbi:MAG: acyltransferase [Prevotellaceae bacterium]|nr:acyltransferase [Prevotellaceae bacterium]